MKTDYKKYKCNFIKKYNEPKQKYNIFSFSIFYMKEYQQYNKEDSEDISVKRQTTFLYNLALNISNLESGVFGKNWYFRIYYDESIFNFKIDKVYPWIEFFNKYKNNKLIQFVKFNCRHFIDKQKKSKCHINLFGTLPRLYPIFEENKLLQTIVVFDADNYITKKYFDEIILFKKSKYDYNAFCSKYETTFYRDINSNINDYCYLRCGMISVNKKLPQDLWNFILYQLETFEDERFELHLQRIFTYHTSLMPDKKIKPYQEFEYGMDEIILNYYIKHFFRVFNFKMRVIRYRPMIMPIIETIIVHIKHNYKKHKLIINHFLRGILNNKFTGNINKNIENFNLMFYNVSHNDNSLLDCLKINIINLKNNFYIIHEINFPIVIVEFISNFSYDNFDNDCHFNEYFITYNEPNFL